MSKFFIIILLQSSLALAVPKVKVPAAPPAPQPTPNGQIQVRPRIAGEYIVDSDFKRIEGESVKMSSVLDGKFSVVVFSKPEHISVEGARGYFRRIAPFLRKLDYQIIVVTTAADSYVKEVATRIKDHGHVLIDESQQSFVSMGLMDKAVKDAPAINAIFVVAPNKQIMFSFASVSESIPFSGEVLVLAARLYRDAYLAPVTPSGEKK